MDPAPFTSRDVFVWLRSRLLCLQLGGIYSVILSAAPLLTGKLQLEKPSNAFPCGREQGGPPGATVDRTATFVAMILLFPMKTLWICAFSQPGFSTSARMVSDPKALIFCKMQQAHRCEMSRLLWNGVMTQGTAPYHTCSLHLHLRAVVGRVGARRRKWYGHTYSWIFPLFCHLPLWHLDSEIFKLDAILCFIFVPQDHSLFYFLKGNPQVGCQL